MLGSIGTSRLLPGTITPTWLLLLGVPDDTEDLGSAHSLGRQPGMTLSQAPPERRPDPGMGSTGYWTQRVPLQGS